MWQFAMNFPANQDRRIGSGDGSSGIRRVNRLLTLGCFASLAVLHVAVIFVFDLFEKPKGP